MKRVREENTEQTQEKRAARHKSKPTVGDTQRIQRAISQRLFLIDQTDQSNDTDGLIRIFNVLGSTGNVYDVEVSKKPTCTCPDHKRGNLCKHIIFVLIKVLKLPQNSNLVIQKALLQSELSEMFAQVPPTTNEVTANSEVIKAYQISINKTDESKNDEKEDSTVTEQKSEFSEGQEIGDCPVCFDPMVFMSNPSKTELLDRCTTCRNSIHRECLEMWLKRSTTCCYCRSQWSCGVNEISSSTKNGEGYLNLGQMQGLPRSRPANYRRYSPYY